VVTVQEVTVLCGLTVVGRSREKGKRKLRRDWAKGRHMLNGGRDKSGRRPEGYNKRQFP
jgi:hypothetical protein